MHVPHNVRHYKHRKGSDDAAHDRGHAGNNTPYYDELKPGAAQPRSNSEYRRMSAIEAIRIARQHGGQVEAETAALEKELQAAARLTAAGSPSRTPAASRGCW
jgi:hypothetical protein